MICICGHEAEEHIGDDEECDYCNCPLFIEE